MFKLANIPPEIILGVLTYLPIPSLSSLRQTSKQWNQFFTENEAYIYRNAAYHHSFISAPEASLQDGLAVSGSIANGVLSWYQMCRRRYALEVKWLGRTSPWFKELGAKGDGVHRIKVDEQRGILLTTHENGGLNVRDLGTDELLWALPRTYVRGYAHCEYGNGFLIFDRLGQGKEVWRLASEYDESPSPPDKLQQDITFTINSYIPITKGSFKPWAVLTPPEVTCAYRFVFPNLLVAGEEKAYIWDVLTCEIVQVISDLQSRVAGLLLGRIKYVELSPLHVLVCGSNQLRLFDRTSGALAFHISSNSPCPPIHAVTFSLSSNPSNPALRLLPLPPQQDTEALDAIMEFDAVHVSPDGRTIAALTEDSYVVIIKDILAIVKGQQKLLDPGASIVLALHNDSGLSMDAVYLAFEFGRIGVVTCSGVSVITLDATEHNIIDRDAAVKQRLADLESDISSSRVIANSPFPYLRCCQVLPFQRERLLLEVSCLQMTETKMLFTWNPRALPGMEYHPHDEAHNIPRWPLNWAQLLPGAHAGPNNPFPMAEEDEGQQENQALDDGELDELDDGYYVDFVAPGEHIDDEIYQEGENEQEPLVVHDEWNNVIEDEIPFIPAPLLFHHTVNTSIVACVGFTEETDSST